MELNKSIQRDIFAEVLCKFGMITTSGVTYITKTRKIIIVTPCPHTIPYVTSQIM